MQSVASNGISSDESDPEAETGHKTFRRISPVWRSEALRGFLRHFSNLKNLDAVAPLGLPSNCYDEDWVSQLNALQLRLLDIKPKEYDFTDHSRRSKPTRSHRPDAVPFTPPFSSSPQASNPSARPLSSQSSPFRPLHYRRKPPVAAPNNQVLPPLSTVLHADKVNGRGKGGKGKGKLTRRGEQMQGSSEGDVATELNEREDFSKEMDAVSIDRDEDEEL